MGPQGSMGERLAVAEAKISNLATSAQVATLQAAVKRLTALNTRQHQENATQQTERHQELTRRITAIDERAFGDNQTSLRSRITVQERDTAVSRGKLAVVVAIVTFLGTFLAVKFQTIAGWFGFKPVTLPMVLYGKIARLDVALGYFWGNVCLPFWPKAVEIVRRITG